MNRVKIEKINKPRQQLNLDEFIRFSSFWRIAVNLTILLQIPVDTDSWVEHLVYLVGWSFTFEESEEHLLENINRNETPLIFDHFIQLLPKVVQNPIV